VIVKGPDVDRYGDNKKIRMLDNTLDKIGKNIIWALKTPIGARPNLPEFGSRLPWLLFEKLDSSYLELAKLYIVECISRCEPRVIIRAIRNVSTEADYRGRQIVLEIDFEVRGYAGKGTVVVDYRL